jgi:DNA-binding transcriptional MerR regulator
MDLQLKKIKAILALDLKVIEEAKKESNPALEKQKALLEKKVAQMNSEVDCLTEFTYWCQEHRPGLLQEVIGSNPEGWKKVLQEVAGLEEED